MTRILLPLLLASLFAQPASAHTGYAARYRSEQLMRRAAALHGVEVPAGRRLCASPYRPLGTLLTVISRVKGRAGQVWRCIVADVAAEQDRAQIIRRGIVVELPPSGAMHLCGTVNDPPRQCAVTVREG